MSWLAKRTENCLFYISSNTRLASAWDSRGRRGLWAWLAYPKVVSWARKKGYALSGTSASLYSTRFATASDTTAADAAAVVTDDEPIACGRGYTARLFS